MQGLEWNDLDLLQVFSGWRLQYQGTIELPQTVGPESQLYGGYDVDVWFAYPQYGVLLDLSSGANTSSWGWNFTKAFFSGFSLKAVYNSFKDPNGCDRLLASTFAGDFNPIPTAPGPTDAVEPAAKFLSAVTYNQAVNYAATTGLTYPLKSSVFRGLLDLSQGIEASVPAVTAGLATVHAVTTTGLAAYSGECH